MTWKDLKKFVDDNDANNHRKDEIKLRSEQYSILKGLPFWISDIDKHKQRDIETRGICCWNHVIGLPQKDGKEYPIFDYEMQVYDALVNYKNIFIKKARGLGITEFILRWMCYLATFDDRYSGCRFNIICGPRIQIAESYISRIYDLFMRKLQISLAKAGPLITVNNVLIQAFPSHTCIKC
jgi:hypothetical protein